MRLRETMRLRLAVISAVALVVVPSALAEPARVGYPGSLAATGDSITRAFNTGWIPLTDWPSNSWSTGTSGSVLSHYRRILAANPAISGRAYNDAITGADMADLAGQVTRAVVQRAEYVTRRALAEGLVEDLVLTTTFVDRLAAWPP